MEIGRGWATTLLFAISFALRWLVLSAVIHAGVPLLYDESGYFERALAFRDLFINTAHLEAPTENTWQRAYGDGHWPPLHPMLLGIGLTIGGPTVQVARFVMVLLSALTTPLIFRLTLAVASSRAAWAAAGIHLLYPSMIAYSHYLWSETSAIFFLLGALWLAILTATGPGNGRTIRLAAAAGGVLGLAALTRAASLVFLLVIPVWLAVTIPRLRPRFLVAGTAATTGLIVLLPWLIITTSKEGRVVPLTTLGGYNLALGNNPWVPAGYGSSWGHEASKARLSARLHEVAERESITWQAAGYTIARQEVQARPGTFLHRSLTRLQMLWAPDFFPLRHLFAAVYPPLPPSMAGLLFVLPTTCYFVLLGLSIYGLLTPAGLTHRGLLVTLVAAGMLLPAVTLGISRLHLPLLALLLPAAGHGLSILLTTARPRRVAIGAGLLAVILTAGTIPRVINLYLVPSIFYAPIIDRLPGLDVTYSDRIVVRWSGGLPDTLRIGLIEPDTRLSNGDRHRLWAVGERPAEIELAVWSNGDRSSEIEIASSTLNRTIRFQPIGKTAWRTWRALAIPGLEAQWMGGGPPPIEPESDTSPNPPS